MSIGEYAAAQRCGIHAYVLMTNHVHLLVSADTGDAVGRMMKALGQRYVQYVNRSYGRNGTLWEGRFRSCPVQEEAYLLACQRLYRAEAGAGAHGGASGRISLVELPRECAGRAR